MGEQDMVDRHKLKDCVLRALQKLNDRDTQKTGMDEMQEIIEKHMDNEMSSFIIAAVCQPGEQSKPWARKASMHLLGMITGGSCSYADAILSNHSLINRACNYIKVRMADADGGVRETAADAIADLAKNYLEVKGEALPCSHAILRVSLDGLVASAKESQMAAGRALRLTATHVGTLDNSMVKLLLRLLVAPNFSAKRDVLGAFASWDAEQQRGGGFIVHGLDGILLSIGALVGTTSRATAPGLGCLGCLGSTDWSVRKSAAEALLALARIVGPDLEHGASAERKRVTRCLEHLIRVRHDRIKPVREAISPTITALQELSDWMAEHPEGTRQEWISFYRYGPPSRRESPDSPPRLGKSSRGSSSTGAVPSLIRSSAAFERFLACNSKVDKIVTPPLSPGGSLVPFDIPSVDPPNASPPRPLNSNMRNSSVSLQLPRLEDVEERGATSSRTQDGLDERMQAANREHLEQVHRMVTALALQVTNALEGLEQRVVALERRSATAVPQPPPGTKASPSTLIMNPYFSHETQLSSPITPRSPLQPSMHVVVHPQEALPVTASGATLPVTTSRAAEGRVGAAPPPPSLPEPSGLQMENLSRMEGNSTEASGEENSGGSVAATLGDRSDQHLVLQQGGISGGAARQRNSGGAGFGSMTGGMEGEGDAGQSGESGSGEAGVSAPADVHDVNAAVAGFLAAGDELNVLRFIQRTQPVWHQLSPPVAQQLLGLMCTCLKKGNYLLGMKAWLWRLADEDNAAVQALFPTPLRLQTVLAVEKAARLGPPKGDKAYELLNSTLQAAWGTRGPEPLAAAAPNRSNTPPPGPKSQRSSTDASLARKPKSNSSISGPLSVSPAYSVDDLTTPLLENSQPLPEGDDTGTLLNGNTQLQSTIQSIKNIHKALQDIEGGAVLG